MAPSFRRRLSHHLSSAADTARRIVPRSVSTSSRRPDEEEFVIVDEDEVLHGEQSQDDRFNQDTLVLITAEEADAAARQELDEEYARVVAVAAARGSNQSTLSAVREAVERTAEYIGRVVFPPKVPTPEESQCACLTGEDGFCACDIQEHVAAGFKRLREANKVRT